MATVYSAKRTYSPSTDLIASPPWKGTKECLDRMGLKPIPETAEDVDDAKLDGEGRYYPAGARQ
jgi:hypothetical protein